MELICVEFLDELHDSESPLGKTDWDPPPSVIGPTVDSNPLTQPPTTTTLGLLQLLHLPKHHPLQTPLWWLLLFFLSTFHKRNFSVVETQRRAANK